MCIGAISQDINLHNEQLQGNAHIEVTILVEFGDVVDVPGTHIISTELCIIYISSGRTTIESITTIISLFLMHRVYAVQEHILVYIHTAHVRHQQQLV